MQRLAPLVAFAALANGCASSPQPQDAPHAFTVTTHTPSAPDDAAAHEARCAQGDVVMCHAAALDHYYAPRTPTEDAAALAAFTKACDRGYAPSCNGLGVMYAEGRAVTQDVQRAAELYRSSCEAGASTGCLHLGNALGLGTGVKKDPQGAAAATSRGACLNEVSLRDDAAPCPALR